MSAVDLEIRAAITRAAADWYAAHRMGPLSEAERAAFLEWLKASPLHMEEYLGVAALEKTLAAATNTSPMSVQGWVDLARADPGPDLLSFPGAGVQRDAHRAALPRRSWASWAAAACVSCGLFLFWASRSSMLGPAGSGLIQTYRTGHGEQRTWKLPDGSTLHVNTDSEATLRFSRAERLVEVDHGQVAVDVVHDEHRPFRVHAGAADAVAVGTNFDVYRLADAVEITVVSGQVAVSLDGRQVAHAAAGTAAAAPAGSVRVAGGQQIRIVRGVLPAAAQPVDLREATAWLERKIVFDQRPLAAVAQEFNRYNDVRITVDDRTLRDLPISGSFDAADTDSFAAFLQSLDGVRVERVASGYRILRSH